MPWVEDKFTPVPAPTAKPDEPRDEHARDQEQRIHAARRFFQAAPPYCIEFDLDGTVMLCEKFYEYWPEHEPEEATTWRLISRHQTLEEAERRLRLICSAPIYYDTEGRVVTKTPRRKPRWDLPPKDDA
jgi:PAS domain-containing protein